MALRYSNLTSEQALEQLEILKEEYNKFKEMGLKLDMSRGKPCSEQLDLSNGIFLGMEDNYKSASGVDTRNYGEPTGIDEAKVLFADILGVKKENVIMGGNSSLNLMYDTISRAMSHGLSQSDRPWNSYEKVKFLCPVPGYDRHFALTHHFGIEMINVPMTDKGPVVDVVEALAREDETIKGMWCVPVYSNPSGAIYSDETIAQLAKMQCAAKDFTIMWDNAYPVHNLYGTKPDILSILDECVKAGNPDRVIMFASMSKVTFSGAGVSCVAGSEGVLNSYKKSLLLQTIGFDKVNMLAHARFLKDIENIHAHMAKHAAILRPKFKMVDDILNQNLAGCEIASWTKPLGGYFINLVTPKDTASRVVGLCKEANVVLTPAGAAFPYGNDPDDSNIRIAPTLPSESELRDATVLLTVCVRIAALEKKLGISKEQ